jgi:hypothetical protein
MRVAMLLSSFSCISLDYNAQLLALFSQCRSPECEVRVKINILKTFLTLSYPIFYIHFNIIPSAPMFLRWTLLLSSTTEVHVYVLIIPHTPPNST